MPFDRPLGIDLAPVEPIPCARERLLALASKVDSLGLRARLVERWFSAVGASPEPVGVPHRLRVWEPHRQHPTIEVTVKPHEGGDGLDAEQTRPEPQLTLTVPHSPGVVASVWSTSLPALAPSPAVPASTGHGRHARPRRSWWRRMLGSLVAGGDR
jgi:hypothetical protein